MKNIVFLCECEFTRTGLKTLMMPKARVFSTSDVEQCRLHLSQWQDGEIDLVVLSLRSGGVDALIRLGALLRRCHPKCPVLIDPGSASIPLLRFYLNCVSTRTGFIDFTQPMPALRRFIEQLMCRDNAQSDGVLMGGDPLSLRERSVLQALMREHTACDIAKALVLNIKTVSGYKQSGLRKLGARNFQDLLMPAVCRYPRRKNAIRAQTMSDAPMYQYAATT